MPTDDATDDFDDELDESMDDEVDDDVPAALLARARRLRDGPLWLGLAPLVILAATIAASFTGSVALILAVLFVGAAIWFVMVWRFARDR